MKKSKHEILCETVQIPQSDFEKAVEQLPCMQYLIKNPSFGMGDKAFLEDWVDSQIVMQTLHISPRTLQTLRSNGTLPYSRIGSKIYYRKRDILKILSDNYTMYKLHNNGK
jgi:hypothetical protein